MKTVHKFTLNPGETNIIKSAGVIKVLHAEPAYSEEFKRAARYGIPPEIAREQAVRGERIALWCLVDSEATSTVEFEVYGTGHPIPAELRHWASVLMPSGLVWHVFGNEKSLRRELD